MKLKKNTFHILTILTYYIVLMALFLPVSILFLGYIEVCFIIGFGFLNTLFLFYKFYLKLIPSTIIGYFISSTSLILIYFLWFLQIYSSPLIGMILYIIFSILFLFFIRQKKWKFNSKKKSILLSMFTIVSILIAANLKNFYPLENKGLKSITFKAVDRNQNPLIGDTIVVKRVRNPLFNLMRIDKVADLITDKNGEFKIKLFKRSNYDFTLKKNYKGAYLSTAKLKGKNYLLLKFE